MDGKLVKRETLHYQLKPKIVSEVKMYLTGAYLGRRIVGDMGNRIIIFGPSLKHSAILETYSSFGHERRLLTVIEPPEGKTIEDIKTGLDFILDKETLKEFVPGPSASEANQ